MHHLNYGIFLLSIIGGVLLFARNLSEVQQKACAWIYGLGMALTFDEFGMWLHLGGGYWQRASFDAVIVLLSLFGMIAFAPKFDRMKSHHWATAGVTLIAVCGFCWLLLASAKYADRKFGAKLENIEKAGPQ